MSREPLAGVGSVKVKLGVLVAASVTVATLVASLGRAASVPLWPAAILPGIAAEHWAGTKDSVKGRVVALDTGARPVAGIKMGLAGRRGDDPKWTQIRIVLDRGYRG